MNHINRIKTIGFRCYSVTKFYYFQIYSQLSFIYKHIVMLFDFDFNNLSFNILKKYVVKGS